MEGKWQIEQGDSLTFTAALTHGFDDTVVAHVDGDHGYFDAEDTRHERQGESILDHVEEAACLFVVIVTIDGGFLDQLVQLCRRGDHALGDSAFLHELSSPKLTDEDQASKLKRLLITRTERIGQQEATAMSRALGLAEKSSAGTVAPKPDMISGLRAEERHWLTQELSSELDMAYLPFEEGRKYSGIYERALVTPTAKLAVIRREDTFTLAPWKPALEPMLGKAVVGLVRGNRVLWSPGQTALDVRVAISHRPATYATHFVWSPFHPPPWPDRLTDHTSAGSPP